MSESYMERALLKIARQINAYDEASLMDLWEKYAEIVRRFEPTKRWEEAALLFGVIQGMRHLPATFTPRKPLGPGLDETLDKLQRICDEQELARPITERKEAAVID